MKSKDPGKREATFLTRPSPLAPVAAQRKFSRAIWMTHSLWFCSGEALWQARQFISNRPEISHRALGLGTSSSFSPTSPPGMWRPKVLMNCHGVRPASSGCQRSGQCRYDNGSWAPVSSSIRIHGSPGLPGGELPADELKCQPMLIAS